MPLSHQNEADRPGGTAPLALRPAAPGARAALTLLLLINLFNYIDRFVLAAVEPDIREQLLLTHDPEDPNAKAKMGLLQTAFLVSYMLTAPLFGLLGERWRRWPLIGIGVALWSLASGASGLATAFAMLLVTRCFVGVGEAAYGPVAPTIISDLYPIEKRGRVLAWFYMAIPVGSALGYALGGLVAGLDPQHQSWRWAFYLVVPPGLLLALWSTLKRDPPLGASDRLAAPPRRAGMKDYLVLLHTRSYVLNTLGMTAMTFAIGAIAWWMPGYLVERKVPPLWGIDPRVLFGLLTAVAGMIATLAGGWAGDALRGRFPGSYFLVSGAGLLTCVPCFLVFLAIPFPYAWIFIFLAEFFLFFNNGPTNTVLANVTHPSMRATAFAMNIFIIHTLGDAVSPPLIGAIADYTSLRVGFVVVSAFVLLGGVIWLCGARHLERDTLAAPHRLDSRPATP